ncbi:hypothetical protein CROQUDRAFT_50338 [Cronartium quercuum f. sp. fusiforme G11]|uniref:AP complex subunit sigma n=1 Tax=Cronartium quercuum f. sp. fusiforme G11 TaxID=708437 RepID=A0A9P6T7U0_9BASI|nr:hypothetical protein CROQUDRAFT_50338 [Cronartium quercuum f. sp. fusiforme G11]
MIHAVLIFNNEGKPRLSKFYSPAPAPTRSDRLKAIHAVISNRSDSLCNFVSHPLPNPDQLSLVYRHYATLYFVMIIDKAESELAILDLIQVFVEALDRCFPSVCELDLIFHYDQLQILLSQMIVGGIVLDTSLESIVTQFNLICARRSQKAEAVSEVVMGLGGGVGWRPFG